MNGKKIYSIINQKGGVGKTTTTINLGTAMAACDAKVLLVDMDPQGNLSTGLGVSPSKREFGTYDLLTSTKSISECAIETDIPNLHLVTANESLLGVEIELSTFDDRALRLRKSVQDIDKYDFILLDCPPALNIITLNALAASDGALVPLQAEFYALEGLSQLLKTIKDISSTINNKLELSGVVLTMFDKRNNLSLQVEEDVRNYLDKDVFLTKIPRNIRLSEAPSHGLPALIYDHRCSGSKAYIELAREFLTKENWNFI
ncbi:ParA family protein [Hyphomicrobiales bacterium]|jgi:chromosome partitioning protein|nr:ParA family protein [Hyphomicrobiales bacterium]MDA9904185.1 ParA family protein [Hyphomicrobiales bacterium]|tara:strand:- start:1422 stop:2201 length:780 start_codon:yes stop_codon:yes gene_type:complete